MVPACTLQRSAGAIALAVVSIQTAFAQLEPKCVENSPERHGGIGCSYLENKVLGGVLRDPLYWHIDRFDNGEKARGAVGPDSVALRDMERGGFCRLKQRLVTIMEART